MKTLATLSCFQDGVATCRPRGSEGSSGHFIVIFYVDNFQPKKKFTIFSMVVKNIVNKCPVD
jgi:hypothetical protein